MRTLHTKKQQAQFLSDNFRLTTIEHKWSTRGYGSSKILDKRGNVLGKATGCGYDRFGAAIAEFIMAVFPEEVYKLAKKHCNDNRKDYQPSRKFYGLIFDAEKDRAWLDGACGYDCMFKVLNAIGYHLRQVAETGGSTSGSEFFELQPVPREIVKRL